MRIRLAVPCLALAALAGCQVCSDETPWPDRTAEPLGARCDRSEQCAAGLACLDATCTVDCSAGPEACPAGAVCFSSRYCLPGCGVDADCLMGHTVGACNGPPATIPGYCYQRACSADIDCPIGRCAGLSLASGLTWQDTCSGGWCMQ